MKQFEPCGEYRESLCLLASGVLPREEGTRLESHLAACDECRRYYDELSSVAGPMARWEDNFADVEVSPAAQARWAKDFSMAIEPDRPAWREFFYWFVDWTKDMIWPCRRIWTCAWEWGWRIFKSKRCLSAARRHDKGFDTETADESGVSISV